MDFMTGPFLLSISVLVFSFFITLFVFFGSVQQIKLAICQLLDACKYSVLYHIVVKVFAVMTRRTVIIQPVRYSQLLLFNRQFFQSLWQVSQCLHRNHWELLEKAMRFSTNPFHHTLPVSTSRDDDLSQISWKLYRKVHRFNTD